jgi:hypothetical protein
MSVQGNGTSDARNAECSVADVDIRACLVLELLPGALGGRVI